MFAYEIRLSAGSYEGESAGGASLIINQPLPRTTMGPMAWAYFRVLGGGRLLRGTRLEDDVGDARHVPPGCSA